MKIDKSQLLIFLIIILLVILLLPFFWIFYVYFLPLLILTVIGITTWILVSRNQQRLRRTAIKFSGAMEKFYRTISFHKIGKAILLSGIGFFLLIVILYLSTRNIIKKRNTKQEIISITNELEQFKRTTGYYPSSLDSIIRQNPLKREWRKDSWDNQYFYMLSNQNFFLKSPGSDGALNTEDDISLGDNN